MNAKTKKRIIRIIIVLLVLLSAEVVLLNLNKKNEEKNQTSSQEAHLTTTSPQPNASAVSNSQESVAEEPKTESQESVSEEAKPESQESIPEETFVVDFQNSEYLIPGLHGTNPTLVKEGDPYIESGAFCIDQRSGIVKNPEIFGTVKTEEPGDYKISYVFTSGDEKTLIERQVKVVPEADFDTKTDGVAVFMYHYVYTEYDAPGKLNSNYILDTDLEEQLIWLKENDFYFPSFAELRAFVDGKISLPMKSCILTFDDGQQGFLNYGIPLLEKYEIPAVSFIIGIRDANDILTEYASPYISFESHSYDMHKAGGYIGHGGVISALTKDEIVEDLKTAIDILGSSNAFAYPYGDYTDEASEAVSEAGILCSFTTEYEWVRVGDDPALLPRVRIIGDAGLASFIGSI